MSRSKALLIAAVVLLGVAWFAAPRLLRSFAAGKIRAAAAARDLDATWTRLDIRLPAGAAIQDLHLVRRAGGDTLLAVDSLDVVLRVPALFTLKAEPERIRLAHARIRMDSRAPAGEDSLDLGIEIPEAPAASTGPRPAAERVRGAARSLIRMLLLPARGQPEIDIADLSVESRSGDPEDPPRRLDLERLRLSHAGRDRIRLEARGLAQLQRSVPFELDFTYDERDRLTGRAQFGIPDPAAETFAPLSIAVDGTVHQDRRAGIVSIGETSVIRVGRIPIRASGALSLEGPRVRFDLAADSLSAERYRASVPRPTLGPLLELDLGGTWDQRLSLDLDLAAPDSVRFDADVIPHGMHLRGSGRLGLGALAGPFTARIHLPRRTVERALAPHNAHFLALAEIDPVLVHAVVTNEDGAFYRHGGFNMDAIRQSIAENARAGRFRRGAGTISMQLVRNLFLGHERTLSRKFKEVALAWIVEHLTALPKERLLEIYMNVIEWGPDVHGADEAARFYFGHDARQVTPAEALFLATVVPSPSKWKWRFERDGTLRRGVRAQMHFIGRRMVEKGWLAPDALPPADSLEVQLLGPARDLLRPAGEDPRFELGLPDSLQGAVAADSAAAVPDSLRRRPPARAPADTTSR